MDRHANYHIENETDRYIILRDDGPWDRFMTITNAAESVINELIPMISGRQVFYYDSEGEFAELILKDGKFAWFRHADTSQLAEIEKTTPYIVKVKYFSETTGELSGREYTYFSADPLKVDDIIIVPVRDTTGKAKVSAINVPEAEIEAFRDKVKTIPAGSVVLPAATFTMAKDASPETKDALKEMAEKAVDTIKAEHALPADMPFNDPAVQARYEAAVADEKTPGTDLEVIEWHQQGVSLQEYAEARVIKGLDDLKLANDDLTIIARLKKFMEERRKQYVQPLNDQVKEINDNYKKLMQPVLDAEHITKQKMLDFNIEQERIRKQQEEINRLRTEAAQKEAAINEGEITEPVKLVEVIPEAPKRVSTDLGSSGMRDNWVYEVTDFKILPDEFKLPNASALNAFAKSTKGTRQVPGLKIYNQPIIATRTK